MSRQIDVLFVNPNSSEKVYQSLSKNFTAIEVPVWSLLLAQSCRKKGYGVAILDCDAERLDDSTAVTRIKDIDPRLVVFCVYGQNPNSGSTNLSGAISLCKLLKESYSEYKTCFVGSHTTALPKEVLSYSCVDFVLLNEGVYALRNLLMTDLKNDLQMVKGIGWKDDNRLTLNDPQSVVPLERMDIDLPGYAWDLLPKKEKTLDMYRSHFWHANFDYEKRTPAAALYTSLGCQFKCLSGNTPINTANGLVPIKELVGKEFVEVYTYCQKSKKRVKSKAINIQKTGENKKLVRVDFNNGNHIDCTPDHIFFSADEKIEAGKLKSGDKIIALSSLLKNNIKLYIEVNKVTELSETEDVYCMEVPGYGCFFANNILVKNCQFCMINLINRSTNDENYVAGDSNSMRFWSPEFIIKEFDKLVEMGVSQIRISDEMYILQKKYYEPLSKLLIERGYGKYLNMWCYSRVDSVNPRFLELLRNSGISYFALGVESGDQKVRQEVTKGSFKEINIRQVVKQVRESGINCILNYIYGIGNDTIESMNKTFDLSMELDCEMMNCYPAMALPGSALHKLAREKGWELPNSYEGYSFHSYECLPMRTESLSAADILKFRDEAWQKFMTSEKFLNLIEKKFGIKARENIIEMTKIKLKRKLLGD